MADARIEIVAYSPSWASDFARESTRIREALGDALTDVHHIGSTAIPGCDAKPIIDMLVVVTNLDDLDVRTAALEGLGYEAMGEFGIPGRRYFRKGSAFEDRTHQIHAFADGSSEIARHLSFRDHLRGNPDAVKEYVALKRRLAEAHPTNVDAYTDAKTAFIHAIEDQAGRDTPVAGQGRTGA